MIASARPCLALLPLSLPLLAPLLLNAGCSAPAPEGPAGTLSPTAKPAVVAQLRDDLAAPRHPADGGGRAGIEGDAAARAGTPGRWTVIYEAGPLGIAEGSMLFLQVSPFWGWSTPQSESDEAPGFTRVSTEAEGVLLRPRTAAPQLLAVEIAGRALAEGERVRLEYGAGPRGATADRFAERRSRLWIAVDGDGDGVRELLADSPIIDVAPGSPARLVVALTSTAHPGEAVALTAAVLDPAGNAGVELEAELTLALAEGEPGGLEMPAALTLGPGAAVRAELTARRPGVYRLRVSGPGGLEAESNPLWVDPEAPRLLWGDLHGHSQLSDGTGTPEDYYAYARDVAGLDVAALTDHDHWGMRFLDQTPEMWQEIRRETERFHRPGRFVTLLGYEWTSWLHGHRHVLSFDGELEVLSSIDPATETPAQLWDALRGRPVLTFAHHSAGGPVATNWAYPPDPELEPVTEVVSVHGSSEAWDSPGRIYNPVEGNFVRDVLDRGHRLGFVGSGDGHDGHPGLSHLASPGGGLAAIWSEERTREGVLEALRSRRVYATNGARILLVARLGEHLAGATIPPGAAAEELVVRVVGTAPIERLDLVRSGGVVESVPGDGRREMELRRPLAGVEAGEYVYLRVVQADGALAWSSPFFFASSP